MVKSVTCIISVFLQLTLAHWNNQNEETKQEKLFSHHLGSKDTVQLSKLDRFIAEQAHQRHLQALELLYSLDDDETQFGREFFSTKKTRAKRDGYKKSNNEQNGQGYYALPLPTLPDDVRDNLSQARLVGRPDPNLIRLANQASQKRSILPPVVNPIKSKLTAPAPADSFEPLPKFPGSIQDIMVDMGINGYPPSDHAHPPEYYANPPLEYPPFTHKPKLLSKPPEKHIEKVTLKPKTKKKIEKPVVSHHPKPEKHVVPHHPKPEKHLVKHKEPEKPNVTYHTPEKPGVHPSSIQDVMNNLGVLGPTYHTYNPGYSPPQPIVYPPYSYQPNPYEATTKKPKKKKKSQKPKPVEKYPKPPSYETPKQEYPKTTEAPYAHTRPSVVDTPEYHTQAPAPFPSSPPKSSAPRDPNNYMAVIPYNDVYKLFNLLNKHVAPTKMPKKMSKRTTTALPPATTKRTEQLRAKVVKKTPIEESKKKKRVKPKKTVTVSLNKGPNCGVEEAHIRAICKLRRTILEHF
jgi:hypothetical protein